MANAFECYETYLAVKAHFTRKQYDFHKYNGKVNTSVSAFESRPDKAFFKKIASKYSIAKATDLYVSNFIDNPDMWIGDFLNEEAETVYGEWQKKIESLSYHFSEECDHVLNWLEQNGYKFNDLFNIQNEDHPIIVKMVLQRVLSLESFIIFDRILDFGKHFDKKLNDVIWEEFWFKVTKYSSFLNIDSVKCKSILRKKIETGYPNVV